jgi:hypothetical protein
MSTKYSLYIETVAWHDDYGRTLFLHDMSNNDQLEFEAQIRSGDFFATLATYLDEMSHMLHPTHEAESANLDALVKKLLYLQNHYQLQKRPALPSPSALAASRRGSRRLDIDVGAAPAAAPETTAKE